MCQYDVKETKDKKWACIEEDDIDSDDQDYSKMFTLYRLKSPAKTAFKIDERKSILLFIILIN